MEGKVSDIKQTDLETRQVKFKASTTKVEKAAKLHAKQLNDIRKNIDDSLTLWQERRNNLN
jgi:hypothetical protein